MNNEKLAAAKGEVMSNYYVSGCKVQDEDIITCEDSDAEFWTIYQRINDGTSQGIIDLKFKEDAEAAMKVYVERDAIQQKLDAMAAAMDGIPQDALDGGWTAQGISNYARQLEQQIAALKGERDALATEIASIKANVAIHAAGFSVCPVCNHEEPCETDDIVWMVKATPATDAILNSVRAEGADKVAEYHFVRIDALKEVSRQGHLFHKEAYSDAINVANLLRTASPKGDSE